MSGSTKSGPDDGRVVEMQDTTSIAGLGITSCEPRPEDFGGEVIAYAADLFRERAAPPELGTFLADRMVRAFLSGMKSAIGMVREAPEMVAAGQLESIDRAIDAQLDGLRDRKPR